ncbi:regulatory protein GemA [Pseudomonas sp. 2023EL-01195]|uniref:gp16 family protein n=1 Tax=Pseudomonas sp. 2023EL-01195 TaxID=3088134 RepID=UPI00296B4664|nr:regulatory protein GemA [Pseudomonas sp. 2023EL-01195]MDW3711910.1 regulatory protein GemA [Pseudomonas sp. 2023EL-01195]
MSAAARKIQIARRQLGMDDDTYRAMLMRTVGATTSKGLTPRQIGRVLAELERLGFQPTNPRKVPAKGRQTAEPAPERAALIGKIERQLAEAERTIAYADGMARRMFQVERVEWCDTDQLRRLVAALAYDAKRHGRRQ